MKRYDYAAIGFYTFDCLGRPVERIPPNGDTDFIEDITLAVSGAAGSAAIAAAKLGLRCLAVGGVGQDLMGDWVLRRLESFKIDTSAMQRVTDMGTSSSIVLTRHDGSRPAIHMRGATAGFTVSDALMAQILDARVVHIGGVGLMDRMDGEPNRRLLQAAKAHGCTTTLDVFASSSDDLPLVEALLPFVDYFLPSIEEATALSGRHERRDVARFFLERGVGCCILTLGERGAYYLDGAGTEFSIPAFDVETVCTCGCGDVFNAGIAAGLCQEMAPRQLVAFAECVSALNSTGLGSQAGVVDYDQVARAVKQLRPKSVAP